MPDASSFCDCLVTCLFKLDDVTDWNVLCKGSQPKQELGDKAVIKANYDLQPGILAAAKMAHSIDPSFPHSPYCCFILIRASRLLRWHGKVRLHRYIRLQGQLSGNTEACNQTWQKKLVTKLGLERKDNKSSFSQYVWLLGLLCETKQEKGVTKESNVSNQSSEMKGFGTSLFGKQKFNKVYKDKAFSQEVRLLACS
eukprot:284129-Pelagomonas_calceolata.AAC.13